jgi:hypothetical protein
MFRPTERQQRYTRKGRDCDYDSFQNHLHGFSIHPAFKQCARDQPTGRRARESIACSAIILAERVIRGAGYRHQAAQPECLGWANTGPRCG